MAKTRASLRRRPRPTAEDRLLDGFFDAWSRAETGKVASAIYKGHVTGAALALELKWTRDKVSRRTDELRSGGIVAKRRNNGWMKTTLTTDGVEAARCWAKTIAGPASDPPPPALTDAERMQASGALAPADRRRLLKQLVTTTGATQADLVARCGVSQPTISRGLKELVAAGFVEVQRDGGRARHQIPAAAVERLQAWLDGYARKLAEGARLSEAVSCPERASSPPKRQTRRKRPPPP